MNIYQWILEVFLGILWLVSFFAVIKPARTVAWTVERYTRMMKFYGFQASIKPTRKSARIIQKGHLLVLLIITVYMALIYMFGQVFLCQMIK